MAREALVDRLVAGQSGRLTVVSAPAGWGKTTVVLEWRRRSAGRTPFGWVSLDEDDRDPATFWAYVIQALGGMFPGRTTEAQRVVGQRGDVRALVIPALVNGLADAGHGILILDDYHLVRSPLVAEQLTYFVDHLPARLHLAIVTRSEPGLPLARLRARGELTELRATDLGFSPVETGTLLNDVLGLRLGGKDVMAVQERTEGWAVALHLAALSLRSSRDPAAIIGGFSGQHEHLVQYLGSEVLARLDPALRTWLTETAILDRFCVALCDAVTERTDGAEMLRQAEQANLFVLALDDRHEWFRYHHLFAEMLRRELTGSAPGHRAELDRRASEWFAAHDAPPEAVRHALQAGDLATAHLLVGRHWNHEYNAGRFATVDGWLTALGEGRVRADPWLSAARVLIWADEGRLDDLDAWLEVDRTVDGYPYAVLRALHRFKSGDLGRAGDELDLAQRLGSEGDEPFWPTVERCVRGATAYWAGDLATARTSLASASALARSYENVAGLTYATGYLALLALDADDVETARRLLDQVAAHLDPAADIAAHFVLALPLLAVGRMLERDGDLERAEHALTRAVICARGGAGRLERVATVATLARLHHRQGDRQQASRLLAEAATLLRLSPDPGRAAALAADEPSAPRVRVFGGGELTAREAAVLRLLPTQLSLREIADALYVSHNTAKTHSRALYRKLEVTTREEAVAAARSGGLL